MQWPKFGDALRGYAHSILKRDDFTCRYCGLDGNAMAELVIPVMGPSPASWTSTT